MIIFFPKQIDRESLEMKSFAIACKRFPGSHTSTAVAHRLAEIHQDMGLDNSRIVCTVTDNASNFAKCFKDNGVDLDGSILYSKSN